MTDNSKLYRNIRNLPIRDEIKNIAAEIADRVDIPIVFCLDSPADKNYFGRHPQWHNQFWCIIQPQLYASELERLITTGVYRALEERQRHPVAIPSPSYMEQLCKSGNPRRIAIYQDIISRINSAIRTWCSNIFIEQYGLYTHPEIRRAMFLDRLGRLQEYVQLQNKQPGFRWYKEVEIANAIDYGYFLSCDASYTEQFAKLISQFQNKSHASKFIMMVNTVKHIFTVTPKCSQADTAQEEQLLRALLDQLHLSNMLSTEYQYIYNQRYPDKRSDDAYVYAFVPEGIPYESEAIRAIRWCNEAILLVNEQRNTFWGQPYPDVHVNYIQNGSVNAYADGKDGIYFISVSDRLISAVSNFCREKGLDLDTAKVLWYFIALHEFAHIVHKDCDKNICGRKDREGSADRQALQWLKSILPFQAKYHPIGAGNSHMQNVLTGVPQDLHIAETIMGQIESLRNINKEIRSSDG